MHSTILEHFSAVDKTMYLLAIRYGQLLKAHSAVPPERYIAELCESIVSQQLSVKAAATIWARTHSVISSWEEPEMILAADIEALRACGMSYQKISYVRNIAEAQKSKHVDFQNMHLLSDEEVIALLSTIKGVGKWTAEMFLIFTLGRGDIFSPGDLGLRNAIDRHYGTTKITQREAEAIARQWAPYRSIASRILWKSLDAKVQ